MENSEFLVKEVKGDEEWTKSGLEADLKRNSGGPRAEFEAKNIESMVRNGKEGGK